MKGLLYNTLIQNKIYYILSALLCLGFSGLGAYLLGSASKTPVMQSLGSAFVMIAPMIIVVTALCSTEKKTEKMIKCNFVKYTLTSGVSHIKFVLTDLVENLLATAYSYGLCAVFYFIIKQVFPEIIYDRIFLETLFFILLGGCVTALINSLVYYVKNAEIAELIVGLAFFTIMGLFFLIEIDEGGLKIEITNKVFLIGAGISAAIYVLACIVEYLKLKKDCT